MEEKNYEISIIEILNMIIQKIWLVVLVSVLTAAAAGVYSLMTEVNSYSVNMKYYVKKEIAYDQQNTSDISYAINIIPSIQEAYASGVFHEKIAVELTVKNPAYSNVSAAQIGRMITFVKSENSSAPTYTLTITSADPELSKYIANIIHDFTVEKIVNENYTEIQNMIAGQSFNISTYDNPGNPYISSNAKTDTIKKAIIGFMAGALVSIFAIVVYGILDPTIRDKNKLAREVDAPIIGVIPRF